MLIKRAYTIPDFERMAAQSQFKICDIRRDSVGVEVHCAKSGIGSTGSTVL
jgi:hypothetical protein